MLEEVSVDTVACTYYIVVEYLHEPMGGTSQAVQLDICPKAWRH